MNKEELKAALLESRTGHGSYGPNYDGNKLAAKIEALIATAPPVTAPQAAGAVSIDSPEFVALLIALDFAGEIPDNEDGYMAARNAFIAHCDAHAAQRYEAGRRYGATSGQLLVDGQAEKERSLRERIAGYEITIASMTHRAVTAEASLARLVEGVLRAPTYSVRVLQTGGDVDGWLERNIEGDACKKSDLLALLPAKAEANPPIVQEAIKVFGERSMAFDYANQIVQSQERATPAPAMGEELPPNDTERAAFNAWFDSWSDPNVGHVEHTIKRHAAIAAWQERACMALRQPGAEKAGGLSEVVTKQQMHDNSDDIEIALAAMQSAGRASPWPTNMRHRINVALHEVGKAQAARRAAATPAAPVSQPAAQQGDAAKVMQALIEDAVANHNSPTGYVKLCMSHFARHTAPPPLSAPAGSEQE